MRLRITDRLEGCCGMTVTYTAEMERIGEFSLRGQAWNFPRIHVDTVYTISAEGELTQSTRITGPCCLESMAASMAEQAHGSMLQNLRAYALDATHSVLARQ